MKDFRKIKKYANTLINIANKSNQDTKNVIKNLSSFKSLLRDIPELRCFLLSKRISLNNKLIVIKNIFNNFYGEIELELISLLLENGDLGIYNYIVERVIYIFESMDTFKKLYILSYKEYNQDEKNEIINSIKDKFDISSFSATSFSADKNILGGIKIRIGNKIIDGSVLTRLKKIKQALLSA